MATWSLAFMNIKGQGVIRNYAEGERLLELVANKLDRAYLGIIAENYERGGYLKEDNAKSLKWHKRAVEKGNPDSQHRLGIIYLNGIGVAKNNIKALMWFTIAEFNGYFDRFDMNMRKKTEDNMRDSEILKAQNLARDCQARKFINCE